MNRLENELWTSSFLVLFNSGRLYHFIDEYFRKIQMWAIRTLFFFFKFIRGESLSCTNNSRQNIIRCLNKHQSNTVQKLSSNTTLREAGIVQEGLMEKINLSWCKYLQCISLWDLNFHKERRSHLNGKTIFNPHMVLFVTN